MKSLLSLLGVLVLTFDCIAGFGQKFDRALDNVSEELIFSTEDGFAHLEIGMQGDVSFFYKDKGQMGWVFPRNDADRDLFSARLTMTTDAFLGEWFYFFGKYRFDDGFHPGFRMKQQNKRTDVRTDELFALVTPPEIPMTLKAGRFAPSFGNYFGRHDSWESALITHPQPYNQLTSVLDGAVRPDAASFASLRNVTDKATWVPVIWGPLYNQGVELAAFQGNWDASFTVMNSAVSSRPEEWNDDMSLPNYATRITYAPSAKWNYGISASWGPYLRDQIKGLPAGKQVEDFKQFILGADLRYSYRDWEVFAEVYLNRFEVPNVNDDVDSLSYYIEPKYKINSRWFVAARWNQQLYRKINVPGAGEQDYDNDIYRIDLGVGAKWTRHFISKLQYSLQHQSASFQNGEHMLSMQSTFKF